MMQTAFTEAFIETTENMSLGMIVLFALLIATWADGYDYLLYVRAMSIILHVPIFQIALPANMLSQI